MIVSNDLKEIFPQIEDKENIQIIDNFIDSSLKIIDIKHGEKKVLSNGISVIFLKTESGTENKDILEAHKKLYDIHYTIKGTDTIVYKAVKDCNSISKNYEEEGDYILYKEKPEKSLEVAAGSFCMIPNLYAHAAVYEKKGPVRKLVFKVPAD
ncbi:MAG: YhcH/YjgK/YiaL family protein [Salegentibacter mishustinae]|nr:YhcH/YjgK/YiaL family protein [Salegentibacter mishustinae]